MYESRAAAEAALEALAAYLAPRAYVRTERRRDRLEFRRSGRPAPRKFAWATVVPSGAVWLDVREPATVRYSLSTALAAFVGVAAACALAMLVNGEWPERAGVAALALAGLVGLNYAIATVGFLATLPREGRVPVAPRTSRRVG